MNFTPAIVIPVYNHKKNLQAIVERSLRQCPIVIVVDDGSTDGGLSLVAGMPVKKVCLPCNQGKGAALWAGAQSALSVGATHRPCTRYRGRPQKILA